MEYNVNIEDLKKDIAEQEELTLKCKKEANVVFYLVIVSLIMMVYNLFLSSFIIAGAFLVIGFLCIRRYNKMIGLIEIHTAIQKFLKMLLLKEQTGEDNFKNIIE